MRLGFAMRLAARRWSYLMNLLPVVEGIRAVYAQRGLADQAAFLQSFITEGEGYTASVLSAVHAGNGNLLPSTRAVDDWEGAALRIIRGHSKQR